MNELQQLRDEITQLNTALTIKNGTIAQLKARNAQLEDRNAALAVQVEARQVGQEPQRCQCCGYLVTESEHRGCLRAAAPQPAPAQDVAGLVNALKTIYDEDYQVPHDSTDGEIKEGMKRCVFRIRRIVKDALAAHDKQSGGEE